MNRKIYKGCPVRIAWLFVLVCLFSACEKFIEVPLPADQVESGTVFSDAQTATGAVTALYSEMIRSPLLLANGGISILTGLTADEIYNTVPDGDMDPFTHNAIPATNETNLLGRLWEAGYKAIYGANAVLEGLANASSLDTVLRQQLAGEAKIVRAFHYFYLVNLFGPVPLVTGTNYRKNAIVPRTASDTIYHQIILDLQEAEAWLPQSYPSGERIRPNRRTATALLARVYLYLKQWERAEAVATTVINSGDFMLEDDLNVVFLAGSKEAIWQLQPSNSYYNTAEGNAFIPYDTASLPSFVLQDSLVEAFEAGDMRKLKWVAKNTVNGITYYYPYKYKVQSSSTLTEYNIVIRLAELYLIRAEARVQLGLYPDALADLNQVRVRAGLPQLEMMPKEALSKMLEQERRVELFCEWGHRWMDLKRTGRIDAVLEGVKEAWRPTDALYPIPFSELLRNPSLTQNPGY